MHHEVMVHVYEANGSVYDIGYLSRCFHDEFKSVERAATTLSSDREEILSAMVSTFGSIQKADDYVHLLVDGMLSKDSDKPWNRAASRTEQQLIAPVPADYPREAGPGKKGVPPLAYGQ